MTLPTWLRTPRATRERTLVHRRGKRHKAVPPRLNLERLEDRTAPAVLTVNSTADTVSGTTATLDLREAILLVNSGGTATDSNNVSLAPAKAAHIDTSSGGFGTNDTIQFNIPTTDPGYNSTTGAFTIQPLSALPTVTDTVIIDGYTQPGASPNTLTIGDNAVLNIVLSGSLAGAVDGLVVGAGNCTVRGLVIDNFAEGSGLVLNGTGNDVVTGNFIGTDVTGEIAAANNIGVNANSTGHTIGGNLPADRNIVSGNNSQLPDIADGGNNPRAYDFGIDLTGNDLIQGNYIGTDKSGMYAVPNGTGIIDGSNNTVGGLTPTPGTGAGNVISDGIECGNQNVIAGNLIGTTATGLAALGTDGRILVKGSYNTIGGTAPGARNIISSNNSGPFGDPGIGIVGPYNLIQGNYIGTDITGTTVLGNPGGGIHILSSYNTIGGTTAAARNIISGGFSGNPITIHQGGGQPPVLGNIVQGNYIGTDVTGTQALANETGIDLLGGVYDTLIGGTVPGAGNVICGNNNEFLIALEGEEGSTDVPANTLIQGNLIGTGKSGAMLPGDSGNAELGIYIVDANITTIGGTVPGAGNTIAFNGDYGVYLNSGSGNSILGNSIFANSPLGIFLNSTNNANNNQTAPILTSGSASSAGTSISGTLTSGASTTFRLEFFANQGLDPSGNAEGQTYLGFATVTTDGSGNATFTAANLAAIPAGEGYVTATATNQSTGDTSQFSNYLAVPTSTVLTSSANPSFFGQPVTLTATVSANFSGFGTPVGSVDFVDTTTNTDLGSVALAGGKAMLTTSALNSGPQIITATYAGNTTFLGSSVTLTLTVAPSILVLNPTASGALSLSGNTSINIPGNVVVDSNSKTALTESGNAKITASSIQVVGGVSTTGNATLSPAGVTGVAFVADPLAGLHGPNPTGLTNFGSVSYTSGTHPLYPGIYTQIKASGTASLTLTSGTYLIEGGGFTVTGSASVSSCGVLIYNTGSNYPASGGSFGGITLGGNGTVNLTAPASGTYAGLVIFQPPANTRAISLSGNAAQGLSGTVYAPAALLSLSGNASLQGAVVVNQLSLSGLATSTLAVEGVGGGTGTAGQLLAGDLVVYVNDPGGLFTPAEQDRIQDAVNVAAAVVAPYGVSISETTDPAAANVVIDTGSTSAAGGRADGVLGCYTSAGEITLIQGWSWYAGADASAVGPGQYDFETAVLHELGHALGLGHSSNSASVMFATLATGVAERVLNVADLAIPDAAAGADALHAAAVAQRVPVTTTFLPVPSELARPAFNPTLGQSAPGQPDVAARLVIRSAGHLFQNFVTEPAPPAPPWEGGRGDGRANMQPADGTAHDRSGLSRTCGTRTAVAECRPGLDAFFSLGADTASGRAPDVWFPTLLEEETDLARWRVEPDISPAVLAAALGLVLGKDWVRPEPEDRDRETVGGEGTAARPRSAKRGSRH
jgi:hypothetical protein